MTKPFQLQSLLDLSNLRLDEAAQQLGRLIAGEQEAGQRLALLMQYRDEYQTRFSTAAQNGIGPDAWRNYRHFLDRLDQAVEQARAMVDTSKQHTATGQKNWLDQRGKVKAFDTLAERHQARVAYGEARQEQKQSDEHSARRYGVAVAEDE
ncbi:MAG: flagellar export protein FliJ [Rhodocyclaceae bacterium]|nr:flagellar export protein FliJ [Rhodocyclaceae bacterium]